MSIEKIVEVTYKKAESIFNVQVTSMKTEKTYDSILKDKNVQAVAYIRGLKGESGETANLKEVSDLEIEELFK